MIKNMLKGAIITITTILTIIFIIAAYKTLLIIIPVLFWVGLGMLTSLGLISLTYFAHGKYIRARVLHIKMANLEDARYFQQALMIATVGQTNANLIHPLEIGRVKLASFPKEPKLITSGNELILPEPEKELPRLVRLETILPPNPTLSKIILGETYGHEIVSDALKSLVHILVAGTSGWGKSIFLQTLLYQVLIAKENTEVYLSDLGGTTFIDFGLPYVDNTKDTEEMLGDLWAEALKRKQLYQATGRGVKSLDMYNAITGHTLPYCLFFTDETTVLMAESKAMSQYLTNIANYARKYGILLICGGQDFKADTFSTTLRNQFSSRFQFKAMDKVQGRLILPDVKDAHEIDIKGQCYAYTADRGIFKMQAPILSEDTIIEWASRQKNLVIDMPVQSINDPIEQAIITHYQSGNGLKDCYRLWYSLNNQGQIPNSIGGNQTQIIKDILQKYSVIGM